jgi:hypothetical protein
MRLMTTLSSQIKPQYADHRSLESLKYKLQHKLESSARSVRRTVSEDVTWPKFQAVLKRAPQAITDTIESSLKSYFDTAVMIGLVGLVVNVGVLRKSGWEAWIGKASKMADEWARLSAAYRVRSNRLCLMSLSFVFVSCLVCARCLSRHCVGRCTYICAYIRTECSICI